ncbi:sulfurtransferase-like selenium metabolism protein YedF [Agathobacter sp.]
MVTVNAMGDACPIPVVKTKNAISALKAPDVVETLVDNEIAVENLKKMAAQKGWKAQDSKLAEGSYSVKITIESIEQKDAADAKEDMSAYTCTPDGKDHRVVVIRSSYMGEGSEELGGVLIKGFIYALLQQESVPGTMLFYNGGAKLTCEGSEVLADLKELKERGVTILTCGTCLNYYGITDKLAVGEVTNMYDIVERMTKASLIVSP